VIILSLFSFEQVPTHNTACCQKITEAGS